MDERTLFYFEDAWDLISFWLAVVVIAVIVGACLIGALITKGCEWIGKRFFATFRCASTHV